MSDFDPDYWGARIRAAANLTQPAQACEHDWAEGYGVPAYCKHCGVARVAQPAQVVDVEKVRQALTRMQVFVDVAVPLPADQASLVYDLLTTALANANGKEDTDAAH